MGGAFYFTHQIQQIGIKPPTVPQSDADADRKPPTIHHQIQQIGENPHTLLHSDPTDGGDLGLPPFFQAKFKHTHMHFLYSIHYAYIILIK